MGSESEDFSRWGPKHLSSVDWHNADHRRCVSACLVKCAYILESDRQEKRQGSQCLAPPWWEAFSFKLIYQLIDEDDNSIFGAIYQYNPPTYTYHRSIDGSPQFVFAFRATLKKEGSIFRDLDLDFNVIRNGLHESSRFKMAMKAVQAVAPVFGSSNVWLAGHSLGAAITMLAGKNMAKRGSFLEAFLFNPPFVSPPIERVVKDERVRHGLRFAGTLIKAGLAFAAASDNHNNSKGIEDSFAVISGWIPCLFVN
ncbi:dynamin-related protein 5A-like [Hibiscus syriacus]|uniref:Dynamin-related protein 5A-like n=1 Tax=Hibiscus syriacus TaxID=106335 RepID=A0A6A3B8V0_HIBSY|nr:GDSL esterase/lipase At4g10955-like [Hibiscus syriacus]KAE8711632.1 dynamin-related protein 5A-like [Hibiscus syriacus]